ncbi:MAG: HD domain-containing protein [Rickettsiales bacterium]|jgi:uncharacterized protein|nr:HD domain-containing protein [Rickettsiales bacterium]
MIEIVKGEVEKLLGGDKTGHADDHAIRVHQISADFCKAEKADREIVALAALLHDVDDYKIFGRESEENLTNAKKIMAVADVPAEKQAAVLDIIKNMGYSKSLSGIRPTTIEGKIVSDADMLEAMGASVIVRCIPNYARDKFIFDKDIRPKPDMTPEEYKASSTQRGGFINHFFEKLLKLKGMMLTESGKKEAAARHDFMVEFLRAYFRENNLADWSEYLENYLKGEMK